MDCCVTFKVSTAVGSPAGVVVWHDVISFPGL